MNKKTIFIIEDSSKSPLGGGQKVTLTVANILKESHNLVLFDCKKTTVFQEKMRAVVNKKVSLLYFGKLAGGNWKIPQSFDVSAAFEKTKKSGRREYLRARIRKGHAEVFSSEGSGRITGLSWADGLVELSEPACDIKIGDQVRYIPFSEF